VRNDAICSACPQVLQVLSNPSHPDLPAKLHLAAAAITASNHNDLLLWLQGGLATHLLHILRSLPSLHLAPAEAACTCAATAAALCNVVHAAKSLGCELPAPMTLQALASQLIRSKEILTAVVQSGMLGPAARQPLPAGCEVHVQSARDNFALRAATGADAGGGPSGQFWTPLRICGYLLEMALQADADDDEECPAASCAVLAQLWDAEVVNSPALHRPGGPEW
jgi:hypothetical protein